MGKKNLWHDGIVGRAKSYTRICRPTKTVFFFIVKRYSVEQIEIIKNNHLLPCWFCAKLNDQPL